MDFDRMQLLQRIQEVSAELEMAKAENDKLREALEEICQAIEDTDKSMAVRVHNVDGIVDEALKGGE